MTQVLNGVRHAIGDGRPRGALCNRPKCYGIVAYQVGATAWGAGDPRLLQDSVSVRFPLFICEACKEITSIGDIVNDRGWQKITRAMRAQGLTSPDRASLAIDFLPVLTGKAWNE